MTTLDTATGRKRLKIPTMAEIREELQNVRTDVRSLWLPIGTALVVVTAIIGGVVTGTVWVVRTGDKANSTDALAAKIDALDTKLDTMQGSVNALMQMQATVAETKAEIGSLSSRLDNMDTAIATQNAWISTTRERLSRQGFETPEFNPPRTGGN